ncbi:AlbA family DNA-binding domain-containing protein [Yaniella halotolerans]|uniref:AlbA family DNA-binding domain-containing protein n=1 Tax=Yaniella halotolerans TaxID=225453 RepID=UPI0003B667BA|nr:ATP-binding protein [Yaniella halotolerans]
MAVVWDGRTDEEKLQELLRLGEQTQLEFKVELDLRDRKHELDFVKDAVAMANRPPGGYILVGITDEGTLPDKPWRIKNPQMFDGATLRDKIGKYIEADIEVVSQIHTVNGSDVVVVAIFSTRSGLPVPMMRVGQYNKPNGKGRMKTKTVFRPGEIFIRDGAGNVPVRYRDWPSVLAQHDQHMKEAATSDVNSLMSKLADAIGGNSKVNVPLEPFLADETVSSAIRANIRQGNRAELKIFLQNSRDDIVTNDDLIKPLVRLVGVGCEAMLADDHDLAIKTLETMYDAFTSISKSPSAVATTVVAGYLFGAAAIRTGSWELIPELVLRPFQRTPTHARYSSWIRYGQIEASVHNQYPFSSQPVQENPHDEDNGTMISEGLSWARTFPLLRPDVLHDFGLNTNKARTTETLLNSLCQFDFLYAWMVNASARQHGGGGAYAASSAFKHWRTLPIIERTITNGEIRAKLFPASTEKEIAQALRSTYTHAEKVSNREKYFTGWEPLPPWIAEFIGQIVEGGKGPAPQPPPSLGDLKRDQPSNVVNFRHLRANQ